MQTREQEQARIRQNNVQRHIELMWEENRAGVSVRDQCELQIYTRWLTICNQAIAKLVLVIYEYWYQ